MGGFDIAVNATESALNSAGSAQREFEIAMDSIAKKTEGVKGQFVELVTNGGLSDIVKLFLDGTKAILEFANSGVGGTIIQVGLLTTGIQLLNVAFKSTTTLKLVSWFKGVFDAILLVKNGAVGLGLALKALNINPVVLAITAIVSVVGIAKKAYDELNVTLKENQEKLAEIKEEYNSASDSVVKIQDELAKLEEQLKTLKNVGKLSITDAEEISKLEREKVELQRILELEKERQRIAKIDLEKQANETVYDTVKGTGDPVLMSGVAGGATVSMGVEKDRLELIKEYSAEMVKQEGIRKSLQEKEDKGIELTKKEIKAREDAVKTYDDLSSKTGKYVDELTKEVDGLDTSSDVYKDVSEAVGEYVDVIDTASKDTEDVAIGAEQASEAYKTARESVTSMSGAFTTLDSAMSEYNSSQGMSIETLDALLALSPEYLSLLSIENGQMNLNRQGAEMLANAKITEAQAMAVVEAQARLEELAIRNAGNATISSANQANSSQNGFNNLTNTLANLSNQAVITSSNLNMLLGKNATGGGDEGDKIRSGLLTTLNAYQSLRGSIGSYTKAQSGATRANNSNTSSVNKNTEALKRQKQALEDVAKRLEKEIEEYEIVIDYVKDKLREEQEAIEDERDLVLDSIQQKMDALEEERDAYEESVQDKIDLIEKEQDAYNKLSEDRIEALKEEKDAYDKATDEELEIMNEKYKATEEYWDKQLENIQSQNDAIQDNLELQRLQEAVATANAKKVMILKNGKFVYESDDGEVSQAEENLANYERERAVADHIAELERLKEEALKSLDNQREEFAEYRKEISLEYEAQLKDLQDSVDKKNEVYKQEITDLESSLDAKLEVFDSEIDRLQAHYDKVESDYESHIREYDEYMETFENMLSAHADAQAEILYRELVGEQDNWNARINALGKFVSNYDRKKSELSNIKSQIDNLTSKISAAESRAKSSLANIQNYANQAGNVQVQRVFYEVMVDMDGGSASNAYKEGTYADEPTAYHKASQYAKAYGSPTRAWVRKVTKYAKGTYGVGSDEVAIVGDPSNMSNKELVIGSSINKGMGVPINLQRGSGVVPAKETNTLTRMLTEMARGNGAIQTSNINNGITQMINIDRLVLDGVQDANGLADELINTFKNYSIKRIYR